MEPERLAETRCLEGGAAVGGECEREIKERTRRTAPAEVIDGDGLVDDREGVLRASVSTNLPGLCCARCVTTSASGIPVLASRTWETALTGGA